VHLAGGVDRDADDLNRRVVDAGARAELVDDRVDRVRQDVLGLLGRRDSDGRSNSTWWPAQTRTPCRAASSSTVAASAVVAVNGFST